MNQLTQHEISSSQKGKRFTALYAIGLLLIAVLSGGGVYLWQHQTTSTPAQQLPQSGSAPVKSDTFTYSSKVGGLSLTLAKTYEIIVNVDGNKGGAPGATLRVGTVLSDNIAQDSAYSWVQVDIDNVVGTIDQEATIVKQQMQKDNYDNVKSTPATVDGQPAVLVTGDGHSYAGSKQVYVLRSGSFLYTITASGDDPASILDAVLKGFKVRSVVI